MPKYKDPHLHLPEYKDQQWRDHVFDLIDQFIAAIKMRAEQLPPNSEDRDTKLKVVDDIVNWA